MFLFIADYEYFQNMTGKLLSFVRWWKENWDMERPSLLWLQCHFPEAKETIKT